MIQGATRCKEANRSLHRTTEVKAGASEVSDESLNSDYSEGVWRSNCKKGFLKGQPTTVEEISS